MPSIAHYLLVQTRSSVLCALFLHPAKSLRELAGLLRKTAGVVDVLHDALTPLGE